MTLYEPSKIHLKRVPAYIGQQSVNFDYMEIAYN